jgi:hypothetical protein
MIVKAAGFKQEVIWLRSDCIFVTSAHSRAAAISKDHQYHREMVIW